ncbi:MAG: DNA-directed RNA polymerase subunit alpha [Candidatus Stahlbacteria bacterium]|nr:DNA-directed RNA polymerase subunit alpha [Candidatus Stahlbacteria bacterium]
MKILPFGIPEKVEILDSRNDYAKFIFSPLERGFGVTIGNSLRRALLSSIQGSAISAVRIDGVLHEFSTISGVYEDIPQIILNLKSVRVKLLDDFRKTLHIKVKGKKTITAKDIETDGGCKIINPAQPILTLTDTVKPFGMELMVTSGRGYVPVELLKEKNAPVGTIFIDAFYSPVVRVSYSIESTRVEKHTDYDKLTMEVWTDGEILPEDAIALASMTITDCMGPFFVLKKEREFKKMKEMDEKEREFRKILDIKVTELELSVRCSNCLKSANIVVIKDLIQKTESEMLQYANFGKKSLQELLDLLKKYNLSFGMDISKFLKDETPKESQKA